jgi:adenosine kinase
VEEILVCGSVAIDVIGKYAGNFSSYEKKYGIASLNVSLQLASLNFSFGGCGLNIAWGLNQLGIPVLPLSVSGCNFEEAYRVHLENAGISTRCITLDEQYDHCALAVILSDEAGNQLTAFHAGASVSGLRMLPSQIPDIEQVKLAILAPEDAPIMLRQARDLADLSIPCVFDPGQGLAGFHPHETIELLELAEHVILNRHEWNILREQTGYSDDKLLEHVQTVIITQGEQGSKVLSRTEGLIEIEAVKTLNAIDATGCGDAYRAGFMAGLLREKSLKICGRLGALNATCNLESSKTQTYSLDLDQFCQRYEQEYGEPVVLS